MEISQELAKEYKEVAALVCMDLDLLQMTVKRKDMTIEDIRAQIDLVVEMKNQLISDAEHRESRYNASAFLFSLPVAE